MRNTITKSRLEQVAEQAEAIRDEIRLSQLMQEAEAIRVGVRPSITFELPPIRAAVTPRTEDRFYLKTPLTPTAERRTAIAAIWQERLEQLSLFQTQLRANIRWQDVERRFLDRAAALTDELFIRPSDPRGEVFARVAAYLSDPEMRVTLLGEINRVTWKETEALVQHAQDKGGWLEGYPLIVVGTGWHGANTALELQAFTKGHVLQVDAGHQRGGVFASVLPPTGPDIATFAVNSKNGRRHTFNVRSLAGRGQNLNPFSDHAASQIPAFDFNLYPGNNVFAAPVAVNSYLAGPALQGARVVCLGENRRATTENERLLVTADYRGEPLFTPAFGAALALGTGEAAMPLRGRSGVAARVREQSRLDFQRFLEINTNRLPKVVTGLEFLQMAAYRRGVLLNVLVDKNVVVAGKGDTALVVLELLNGLAPDSRIYQGYVPQERGPRNLYWIGPESRSRKALCEELRLRPRYRVSVNFPRDEDDPFADIIPVPGKVVNFGAPSQYGREQFIVDVLEPDGTREYIADADLLIICTGLLSDQAAALLSGLTGFGPLRTVRDLDGSALYREVPGWENRVVLVGPAANLPVSEYEREVSPALAQVGKNAVSIWLNTEKVVLASRALARNFNREWLEDIPF